MSVERPLPSNRRTRPRGVPLLPPEIAEQAVPPPPPPRRRAARATRDEAAATSAPGSEKEKPAAPPRKPWKIPNPFQGKGPVLMAAGRLVLGALLFFAMVVGLSFGAHHYASSSSRFAVKNILIEGAAHRPQPEIARLAGVALGKNIFTIDLEAARRGVMSDPWIERATVDRKLPGSLTIQVVEREPLSLVSLGGSLYLSCRGGEIFKRVEAGDPIDFPLITGLGGEGELVRDREGLTATVRRGQELMTDYVRLGPRAFPLQEVHATPEGTFELIVGRDGIRLVMGKPPYRLKIERAARVLGEVERRRGQPSVIFLDNEAHPERVVARMR